MFCVLKVVVSNDAGMPMYARVELTKQLTQLCLERIERLQGLQNSVEQLYQMDYWDYNPEFFECFEELDDYEIDEQDPVHSGLRVSEVLDGDEFIVLHDMPEIPPDKHVRIDACRMEVSGDRVNWHCYDKHCSVVYETEGFPVEVLREINNKLSQ